MNRNIIEERTLEERRLARRGYDNLFNWMIKWDLQDFQNYQRKYGGWRTQSDMSKEYTALKAIDRNTGDCTELSKILYAVLKRAGYKPHFVFVDPWKSQYRRINFLVQQNPNYWHVAIGLHHGGKKYVLDPALADPHTVHQGGRSALSLRQYLSLDYSNRGVAYENRKPPPSGISG